MKKEAKKKEKKNTFDIKKIKQWALAHKNYLILIFISVFCLIFGSLAIGFLKTLPIIFLFDVIVFLCLIPKKSKKSKKEKKEKKEKKKGKHRILKCILIFIFSLGIIGVLCVSGFLLWIASNAEQFDPDKLYSTQSTIIYDKDGIIRAKLGAEKREIITYDELPEVLINAIVATEDSRFFQHNGFDLPRFVKATIGQLSGNSGAGGASTLTMQLSKNNFTSTNDEGIEGIIRKFTDIYISIFQIEKNYTKQEILEFYVNDSYLGGGAYGVEQACLTYFGKHAKDINLAEASLIAGLFNAPFALDPYRNPEGATIRRSTVLYLMELHGYITNEERKIADSIPVEDLIVPKEEYGEYQSFIDTVVQEVKDKTGKDPYSVPMEIYTTMDSAKQEHVEKVLSGEKFNWANDAVQSGITVLDTKTGAIVAIGGGRNKQNTANTYNYATEMKKQIGSTAKPLYDYGPAIEYNNWDTYHPFVDEKWSYTNGPEVNNWDGLFQGLISMRTALEGSRNIPALKTFQSVANANIKNFVTKLGLSPELENGKVHEAHSIGGYTGESPLTLAAAYAAFGNKGVYNEPYSFTKIVFRDTGEVYENKSKSEKVMGEDTAYMVTNMLLTTTTAAIGNYGKINNASIAAKTGTTNYPTEIFEKYPSLPGNAINDLWVVGYDPNYTMAVWYGYDFITQEYVDNKYYTTIPSAIHASLFHTLGVGIFTDSERFVKPNNVKEVAIEKESYPAKLPSEFTPKNMIVTEYFKEGTEPTEVSTRYAKLESPKNVESSIKGTTLTLSWDAINTPEAIDEDILKKYFQNLYKEASDKEYYLNQRLDYIKKNIGEISYNVYVKQEDGELELIANTQNTTMDYEIHSTSKPITFVVKATYTIFKDNMSDGAELTIDLNDVAPIITATLMGDEKMIIPVGTAYVEPGVLVSDNLIDVTSSSTITREIKNSKGKVVDTIDIDNVETYTITYHIKYHDFETILKRTLKVLESSEED